MNLIIYPSASGAANIVFPTGLTSLSHIIANDIPAGSPYCIISSDSLFPPFYDAYDFSPSGAVFVADRAKAIQANRWRAARAPRLSALDVAYMKAIEQRDESAEESIAAKKQALRDVTLTPITESTPEGIYNFWPSILTEPAV